MDYRLSVDSVNLSNWLDKALASELRAANTTKNPQIRQCHEEQSRMIRRTLDELATGGIQTDIEKKK